MIAQLVESLFPFILNLWFEIDLPLNIFDKLCILWSRCIYWCFRWSTFVWCRKLIKTISINKSQAAVACIEYTANDKCSIVIVDMTASGGSVRRVLRAGAGLSALHLIDGRLVAGGGFDREGWVKTWRVLDRLTCSRQLINKEDGSPLESWRSEYSHVLSRVFTIIFCRCAGGWVTALAQINSGNIVLAGDSKVCREFIRLDAFSFIIRYFPNLLLVRSIISWEPSA